MPRKNKYAVKQELNLNVILLFLIPIMLIGGTVAKYVQEKNKDVIYEAKNFYFVSDLLSDNTAPKAYTYEKGVDTISFKISNNIDELRFSDVETQYSVCITDIQGNTVQDKNENEIKEITGKLSNKAVESQNIEFTNIPGGIYKITAKALKPYTKKLEATFVLTEKVEEITYEVHDYANSPILQLIVQTQDYSGDIKITWPDGVAPDSTNSKFAEIETGYTKGNTIVSFEANSEYIFQFFKQQPSAIFNKDNFSVERN